ncbi:MAG TPA: PilZ domain-containing protein [Candidatus Acidoferrales bacterium]|nr:PilZ domain-containing protein [Candidatus Acidoferrales bacterium]
MAESAAPKKRRYPRVSAPKAIQVAWQTSARKGISRVSTFGLGGLFLHEADPPPNGSLIQLFFEIPGGQVRARGTVRSVEAGRGMGVEFTQMRQEERARLANMIRGLLS